MDPQSDAASQGQDDSRIEDAMLDPGEAGEEIPEEEDIPMESDDENEDGGGNREEIALENDSIGYFDLHKDSVYCIAQHPSHPELVATGGGDDTGYVFDVSAADREQPVLPVTYQTSPQAPQERKGLQPLFQLSGHHDESIAALAFTLPKGDFLVSADMNGRTCIWQDQSPSLDGRKWSFLVDSTEEGDILWLTACPHASYPNAFAIGRGDGSVWVYTIDASDRSSPLTIVQAYYIHTLPCTAGSWTSNGSLLATVSEDSSFCVFDPFGEAAGIQLANSSTSSHSSSSGQTLIHLTAEDQRFAVEGGLYSVALSPSGTLAALGGAGGHIRIVGLPRVGADLASLGSTGAGPASKSSGGGRQSGRPSTAPSTATSGQAGQLLASLCAQSDSIETLAFSKPPLTILAAGSVDGSIALFDASKRFAVRRLIREAHEELAVVQVNFANHPATGGGLLTSAGMDGVVRRWDVRGAAASGENQAGGMVREWKGHAGGGEKGGVLEFVQGDGSRIVTAGDDGISLVFDAAIT